MAPQGFYVSDGTSSLTISAQRKRAMSFQWAHSGVGGQANWAIFPANARRGAPVRRVFNNPDPFYGRTAQFRRNTVRRKGQTATNWIDNSLGGLDLYFNRPLTGSVAHGTFSRVMRRRSFIARASDVGDRAFTYSAPASAWATPYQSSDEPYRQSAQRDAASALGEWNSAVSTAIRRARL